MYVCMYICIIKKRINSINFWSRSNFCTRVNKSANIFGGRTEF